MNLYADAFTAPRRGTCPRAASPLSSAWLRPTKSGRTLVRLRLPLERDQDGLGPLFALQGCRPVIYLAIFLHSAKTHLQCVAVECVNTLEDFAFVLEILLPLV